MNPEELKRRTKQFALRIIRLVEALPKTNVGRTIADQLVRSGTSVAANYRAVCKARSRAEFRSKLGVVEEEADESAFWLELAVEAQLMSAERIKLLLDEAYQLVAIMAASRKTSDTP